MPKRLGVMCDTHFVWWFRVHLKILPFPFLMLLVFNEQHADSKASYCWPWCGQGTILLWEANRTVALSCWDLLHAAPAHLAYQLGLCSVSTSLLSSSCLEWRAAIPQPLTLLPHCLSGSPVRSWILLWLFCCMVNKITDDSLVHLQVWDLVPFYPWRQEPQRKYFGKIIWAHAPSLSFIPMAPEGRYFMAHLIKQLPLLSSKNIHIKPVIRAWNPVGVTIYTTKENKVTSKTSQLCGMNRKKAR